VIVGLPKTSNQIDFRFLLKKPETLVVADIVGFWLYRVTAIEENENGPGEHEVVATDSEFEFRADGTILNEGFPYGNFVIDENRRIVVTTFAGEVYQMGVNASLDLMISVNVFGNKHSLRVFTNREQAHAADDFIDTWTYVYLYLDLGLNPPEVEFGQGEFQLKEGGVYLDSYDDGSPIVGTYTVSATRGRVTLIDDDDDSVSVDVNNSLSIMSSGAGANGLVGFSFVVRSSDSFELSDLAGDWAIFGYEIIPEIDTDNDGMDDNWELDNFMTQDRDGSKDFDLDSLSDKFEYVTGTDPKDSRSAFLFTVEPDSTSSGNYVFSFRTLEAIDYVIQVSLKLDSWADVATVVGNGRDQDISVSGLNGYPGESKIFLRILAKPSAG
jgi:hypothetical protein